GAGGLLSPLTQDMTCLDLLAALHIPAVFVMGDYLGAVSHALSGLELLRLQAIPVAAVVISQSPEGVGLEPTREMMAWFRADLAYFTAARAADEGWAHHLAERLRPRG
ncbi:MAG: dethiobiotin synthase, partial [Hyphomonadaceae bacterium]|nr:dethiobiotin synthase [Hyphomonadaceae bacterium]